MRPVVAGVAAVAAAVLWLATPAAANHGGLANHLPPTQQGVELVSKLELTEPFGDVAPRQIGDLAVHRNSAYVMSRCARGGFFSVDIGNPGAPAQRVFVPALSDTAHGEGAHAITLSIPGGFSGDVLATNNEPCGAGGAGGFDLYDVSDPANPQPLVQGAGDKSPDGSLAQDPSAVAKTTSSVFAWQDGARAYLAATDRAEQADLDIFDITDPSNPQLIAEFDPSGVIRPGGAQNDSFNSEGVVVKRIGGRMTMLVSFMDGGHVQLDVDDPANPAYIGDTNFPARDPLVTPTPSGRPAGNAHQAEFSHNGQLILGADEDLEPYRLFGRIDGQTDIELLGLPTDANGAQRPNEPFAPGTSVAGDTRFVGEACVAATTPAPQADETVAVAERGTCDFDVKAANASAAGYDMVVIFNNVLGPAPRCDGIQNMIFDNPAADIPAVFVGRAHGFQIINAYDPATFRCVQNDPTSTPTPAPNRAGVPVEFGSAFDGWGYGHLYDASTNDLIDDFAIPEGIDRQHASGSGELSIHELATDPSTNLAYASWRAGGLRVLRFSSGGGLEETGRFIDAEGNNFWGVEPFTDSGGNRLIAASDRDYGLYILKYTGPGAVLAPPDDDLDDDGRANGADNCPSAANPDQRNSDLGTAQADGLGDACDLDDDGDGHADSDDNCALIFNPGLLDADRDGLGTACDPGELSPGRCANVARGTNQGDALGGTIAGDALPALGGADRVFGFGGDDCLAGGGGNDRLFGGDGDDKLRGDSGDDRLYGDAGDDYLSGGAGNDVIKGGAGTNRYFGRAGNDRIYADNGVAEQVNCGSGRDWARVDDADTVASCERVRRTSR